MSPRRGGCADCGGCGDAKNDLLARLNKRVNIWRPRRPDDPPPQTDDYGEPIDSPIKVCTVWAAIEPLRGREYFAAQSEQADVTTRIRIRYREDIDRTMFVEDIGTGVWFEIGHIIHPNFARRELQLMSKERQ